jgi:SEC-C motif
MGAIAEAFVAYAKPLLDQTDGSEEQLNRAFAISQLCYNLALLPDDSRSGALAEMQPSLGMDDEEFEDFRRSVVSPMIQRHQEMFPLMHRRVSPFSSQSGPSLGAPPKKAAPGDQYPGTDRYAPCPCGSGEKYKFCCGKKGR